MKFFLKGPAGHPLHPPLTDVTVGAYTFATAMAVLSRLGVSEHNTATAWWIGSDRRPRRHAPDRADRLRRLARHRDRHAALADGDAPPERDALRHGRLRDHGRRRARELRRRLDQRRLAVLTLVGFGLLTLGGWLGGAIVFTHGMRVLSLVDEPTERAVSPMPLPEKEEAEGGG